MRICLILLSFFLVASCRKKDKVRAPAPSHSFSYIHDYLFQAVAQGDTSQLEGFLKEKKYANIDVNRPNGDTLLHVATNHNQSEVVRFLLEKGAGVNIQNRYSDTPLHVAVKNNNVEIVSLLLEEGADMDVKNQQGNTPLFVAVRNDYVEVAQKLLEEGADTKVKNLQETTFLHILAKKPHQGFFDFVLDQDNFLTKTFSRNIPINEQDNVGDTPLHKAVFYNRIQNVSRLVEEGADTDIQNNQGDTPLHIATKNQSIEIIKILLEKGASKTLKNNHDTTSLSLATASENSEILKLFEQN